MRAIILLSIAAVPALAASLDAPKFYSDDPLIKEPAPRQVDSVKSRKLSDYYDFFSNQFFKPGELQSETKCMIPARGVNTLGEAIESSWYTRRHYYRPMPTEELVRGPGNEHAPSPKGAWTIVAAKNEGVTPGFTIVDASGRKFVLKFDPLAYPELASAADVISSKFFHALGYNVPENYIVRFTRDQVTVGKDTMLVDQTGKKRPMTEADVEAILAKVPREKHGGYRATASLFLSGKPLGPYRYYGTRRDDPNDVIPHEHRRDLRGLSVFAAWLGHDDSRAINSLDTLVEENGVKYVKHHLIDFGSTLGSASYGPNSPRAGQYLFAWKPALAQAFSLGTYAPAWQRANYPDLPGVGLFEAEAFDPLTWVPEYPNSAFQNRNPDDAFWAAKQVMSFTDEQIRAIVAAGEYSDPRAEMYVADTLIKRRDKIGKTFFAGMLPLDRFRVEDGELKFTNLAEGHDFESERAFRVQWSAFDNRTRSREPLTSDTGFRVPANDAEFLVADISGANSKSTIAVYLRGEDVVGIDRTW